MTAASAAGRRLVLVPPAPGEESYRFERPDLGTLNQCQEIEEWRSCGKAGEPAWLAGMGCLRIGRVWMKGGHRAASGNEEADRRDGDRLRLRGRGRAECGVRSGPLRISDCGLRIWKTADEDDGEGGGQRVKRRWVARAEKNGRAGLAIGRVGGVLFNDQLTDGGPPPAPELADGSAGPPFGEAPCSSSCNFRRNSLQMSASLSLGFHRKIMTHTIVTPPRSCT